MIDFVPDHFDYIKKLAGPSIIGFGGDYDGVNRQVETLSNLTTFTLSNIGQKLQCVRVHARVCGGVVCVCVCVCVCVQGTNGSGGCV